jgi:hypothetical protein
MRIELQIYPEGDLAVYTRPGTDSHPDHGERPITIHLSDDDTLHLTEEQGESLFGKLGNAQKVIGQHRRDQQTEGGPTE